MKRNFEARTGCTLVEGYGLTEASPCISCNPPDGRNKAGSIGLPFPGTDISLRGLDDPLRRVAQGESGELCVRGPQVMRGYWNRPEETRDAFVGGWLRTGDVAVMDDDGYFAIVDRIKDLILVNGFNVYPRAVEEAIYRHPAVAECTVIGVPDPYHGEVAKAFVVCKPDKALQGAELALFLRDHLAPIELPRQIEFRDSLPKDPDRQAVQERAYRGGTGQVRGEPRGSRICWPVNQRRSWTRPTASARSATWRPSLPCRRAPSASTRMPAY